MHLNKLVLRNFKKFRRAELEFSDGLTGIVGSNGAGKSTIVEAIAWALYGNRASAVKRDFIRNSRARDSDAVEVALTISLGRQELVIHRAMRGKGLTPEAHLILDGQRIASGSKEVDGRLEEVLKISYQDFMKTFYARQKDLDNLLKEGGMGKREYLLKLLGLEDIKEYALDMIKADRAALEEEKNRLAGALGEIGDVCARLEGANRDIQMAEKGLQESERTRAALAAEEEEEKEKLEAFAEKMRRHETLAERKSRLEAGEVELEEKANAEQTRLLAIDLSRKRLGEIKPLLERLAGVKERLEALEPQRTAYEELARDIASRQAALQGEKKALSESQRRLQELVKDEADRETLLPKEVEHGRLQERLATLEDLRDRYRDLQTEIKQLLVRVQSVEAALDRATGQRQDLRRSSIRLEEIAYCREEETLSRDELARLVEQKEKQKVLEGLQARKRTVEERLAQRRSEAEKASREMEALGDLKEREAFLLAQDRELDQLNSELSRILAEMRGSYKVAETALAQAEEACKRVEALGEEGLCPTCERPLQGQKGLLVDKYERSAALALEEKKRLEREIAGQREKMEGAARSRSNLREAFDRLNARKARRAALHASLCSLAGQIQDLQAEQEEIASRIAELGEFEFDESRLAAAQSELEKLQPLVQEHAALTLRLEQLPDLEKEIAEGEGALAALKERQWQVAAQAGAMGYEESDFLEAKKLAASLKPVHDRFLALSERVAAIPALRERCSSLVQSVEDLEGALESLYRSQKALGYDPEEFGLLTREKKDLAEAEREREKIALLLAGEEGSRERLAGILAEREKMMADLQECLAQILSLSYRPEEHEKAREALTAAAAEHEKARAALLERQVQMGVLQAAKQRLVQEAERKAELEKSAGEASRRAEVVDVTRALVNSFMDQVLMRVKNDIARTAGEILEEVSGKYSLLKIDDDFNIQVEDGGTFYPISRYSGGEIDMIAVSVRVAISEYLMRFGPDGSSYSFLILDEVFGSQDQEHREKMIQMLRSLEERFPQIIAISHISDVQGQFDNTLLVVEDEMGNSRVEQ